MNKIELSGTKKDLETKSHKSGVQKEEANIFFPILKHKPHFPHFPEHSIILYSF